MRNHLLSRIVFICLCAGAVGYAQPAAHTIYVEDDARGVNDGSSWQNAYPRLQDALARAKTMAGPVEIRVAQGVYKPDQGAGITPGDQMASFQLLNGVTLKGGYAGLTAADPDTCDPNQYESVLSGDLKGDDNGNPLGDRENSCCIVVAHLVDETAVMEGFTISGCGASQQCSEEQGNGVEMLIDAARPLFQRCRFPGRHRRAGLLNRNGSVLTMIECEFDGSGIRSLQSGCVLVDCLFRDGGIENRNHSSASLADCMFDSAGMATDGSSTATVTGCTFQDCEGGAMSVDDSELVLTNCLFQRNGQDFPLGGTIVSNGSILRLVNCSFLQNRGHVINGTAVTASLSRCSFVGNSSRLLTPLRIRTGSLILRDCEFIGNSVQQGVGAVEVWGNQLQATGCVFAGNSGGGLFGAGAILSSTPLLLLSNCTFVGNRGAPSTIECWAYDPTARVELTHSIVWDGPNPITGSAQGPSHINVSYSDIRGGHPGKGNIDVDPCFVNPGFWADPNDPTIELGPDNPKAVWFNGDYHLKSQAGHWDRESRTWVRDEVTSACIDAGDPNAPLGLEPFPNGAIVNLGAYGGTVEASKSYFGGPVCETQIAGDINGDCKVDQTDMDILLAHWLMEGTDFGNTPPTVTITIPTDGQAYEYPTWIPICAEAADVDGSVLQVRFRMRSGDGSKATAYTDAESADGWRYDWFWWRTTNVPFAGTFEIWAEAMDDDGAVTVSPKIEVKLRVTTRKTLDGPIFESYADLK